MPTVAIVGDPSTFTALTATLPYSVPSSTAARVI